MCHRASAAALRESGSGDSNKCVIIGSDSEVLTSFSMTKRNVSRCASLRVLLNSRSTDERKAEGSPRETSSAWIRYFKSGFAVTSNPARRDNLKELTFGMPLALAKTFHFSASVVANEEITPPSSATTACNGSDSTSETDPDTAASVYEPRHALPFVRLCSDHRNKSVAADPDFTE
jgi:hypothetical protein